MTKAAELRKAILAADCVQLSMKDGYGTTKWGKRLDFSDTVNETPKEIKSLYTDRGKCVKYTCVFSDKSKLIYTYNTRHNQYKLVAK